MRIRNLGFGSAVVAGLFSAGSASAQLSADIRIGGGGPISGRVVIGDPWGHGDWRRDSRYRPRIVRVEIFKRKGNWKHGWFSRFGRDARIVVVYYDRRDDCYYDEFRPGLLQIRVFEQRGRFYRLDYDRWDDRRDGRYDDYYDRRDYRDWRFDDRYHGRHDGRDDRRNDGRYDGRDDRRNDGRYDGRDDRRNDGRNNGGAERRNDGRVDGRNDPRNDGRVGGQNDRRNDGRVGGQNDRRNEGRVIGQNERRVPPVVVPDSRTGRDGPNRPRRPRG